MSDSPTLLVWTLSGAGSAILGALVGAWLPYFLKRRAEVVAGIALMKAEIAANLIQIGGFERAIQKESTADDPNLSYVPRNIHLHRSGLSASASILASLKPETLTHVIFAYSMLEELETELAQHRTVEQQILTSAAGSPLEDQRPEMRALLRGLRLLTDRLAIRVKHLHPALNAANESLRVEFMEFRDQARLW